MEVTYYPGCSLSGTAKEYGESTEAICKILGIKLQELDDWNCCGASSAHAVNDTLALELPMRNLMLADKVGLDVVTPCSSCYQRLKVAEKKILAEKEKEIPSHQYKGNFHIKHLVDFIWDDVGAEALRAKIVKPLKGLKPVCYYGCLSVRAPWVTDTRNPENPQTMDNVMATLGADVKKWSFKTDCCGGSLILTHPETARKLVQKLLDMAEEAGANCIVTGCPMCFSNLDSYQNIISRETGKEYHTPIFYLSELIGVAFGEPSAPKWLRRHLTDPRPFLKQQGLI